MKYPEDLRSGPRCLICHRLLPSYGLEPLDHPDPADRAMVCEEHLPDTSLGDLSEVYARRDDYVLRVREISAHVSGTSIRRAWYTTRYFSLLLELSSDAFLLLYPVKRRPALLYVPKVLRASEAPRGLRPLTFEVLDEVHGPCDSVSPKPGLRGLLRASEASVPLSKLDFQGATGEPDLELFVIEFQSGHSVQVRAEGWEDLGYARHALDLCFEWIGGHELGEGPLASPARKISVR